VTASAEVPQSRSVIIYYLNVTTREQTPTPLLVDAEGCCRLIAGGKARTFRIARRALVSRAYQTEIRSPIDSINDLIDAQNVALIAHNAA
jgi:hypothetical protein